MPETVGLNGAEVVLLVNTGTDESPTYEVVGHQRGLNIEETVAEIDVSSKESANMRVQGGRYGSTLSLDALYVPDDAAYQALKTAFRARTAILVRVQESDEPTEEAAALITQLSSQFPDQGASVISASLRVDGAWAEVSS